MKRIMFLHSSSELYGSDKSLYNLVRNLDKSKFECIVILPEEGPLVGKISSIENTKVIINKIATLRRKNLSFKGIMVYMKNFLKSTIEMIHLIKENNIDVVYTNTSVVFPGAFAAKLTRKKNIWHVREIISNKFERTLIKFIINTLADVIIANSKATGAAISNNSKKVKVVYNAIENSNKEKTVIKSSNENTIITIGMAGRINRWKGQKLFVDMAKLVVEKNSNVKFLIAGDVFKGEDFILEDLKKHIKNNDLENYVELLGRVDDMTSFYDNLDIFILPSIQPEPFGLVVIEAMDRGVPVVATNHGGPVEIIENNKDGFLVDYKNATEMSEVVTMLMNDEKLRYKIAKNAKEKRCTIFSIENYVKSISIILENI